MAWSRKSGVVAAALFWVIVIVGITFDYRAADLLLAVASIPILLLLSIGEVRMWRRGKNIQRGTKSKKEGSSIVTKFRKWYYGE